MVASLGVRMASFSLIWTAGAAEERSILVARATRGKVQERRMWKAIAAVSVGASIGALLRWWLGITLNHYFPAIPPGTLAANLIGGYVVGVAVAVFAASTALAPEWRLLIITGFCGGLTTFSSFSAELVLLMQQGRPLLAAGAAAAHLAGSVVMTLAGIGTVSLIRG
jgi:fluoride exporter